MSWRSLVFLFFEGRALMDNKVLRESKIAKALSSESRLLLLDWLREPERHFQNRLQWPRRRKVVATKNIQQKWNVGNLTTMKHIGILKAAGLITVERHNRLQWISRNTAGIAAARTAGHLYVM